MSFSPKSRRPARPNRFSASRVPSSTLLRTALFGLVAIAGALGGLVRHCTHELAPMRVPVTARPLPTYDADAGELPVPDFVEPDGG